MKGCSSLGSWRAAALVLVEQGAKPALALLDIEEAIDPVTPHWDTSRMPTEPALETVKACGKAA